jgi:hypothetical protein
MLRFTKRAGSRRLSDATDRFGQELDVANLNARKRKEWSRLANPLCKDCEFCEAVQETNCK